MILVFCEIADRPALWAASRLKARGLEVQLVTAPVLSCALRWEHHLSTAGAVKTEIELADGRKVTNAPGVGVLNRLSFVPTERLDKVAGADRDYAVQEFNALFLSWLNAMPGPVINPPAPQGLGGTWRHRSVWAALAGQVDLPAAPYRQTSEDDPDAEWLVPPSPLTVTVFAIGKHVVAPPFVPDEVRAGCLRLAKAAKERLLGIDLVPSAGGGFELVKASPVPDLIRGGEALIDALVEALAA